MKKAMELFSELDPCLIVGKPPNQKALRKPLWLRSPETTLREKAGSAN